MKKSMMKPPAPPKAAKSQVLEQSSNRRGTPLPENTLSPRQNRFTRIASIIAIALVGLVFILLSVEAILYTCRIDQANPYAEIINFDSDFVLVNLAVILLSLIAFVALMRKNIRLSAVSTRDVVFLMLIVTTVVSLAWINMVQSVASGDAMILLNTARDAAQDNYNSFYTSYDYYGNYSYYLYYPFQLGYVFFAEISYRIFGTASSDLLFQVPNVIALDFIYVGLVMITQRIFQRRSVTNMTAIILTVCLQPMFMTTFTYGILIGLSFSVWSVFFTVRYMQENKLKYAGIAVLLIAISVVMKYNNMIMLAAICIALILHAIDRKRLLALAAAAVMVLCSVGAQKLVIYSYSVRSGAELKTQVSQTLYAYMGINDSGMAPGWYNGLAMETLRDTGMDVDAANEIAREGIEDRLTLLSENGELVDFSMKKLISQLNEPAFESIWISQVRSHDLEEGEQLPNLVTSIYSGGMAKVLDNWFNYYVMMLYIGFAAGMVWMLIRRRTRAEMMILPSAVMGGVLYHLIFEAKSQYLLPYFILLTPFAMYGLLETTRLLSNKLGWLFRGSDRTDDKITSDSGEAPSTTES